MLNLYHCGDDGDLDANGSDDDDDDGDDGNDDDDGDDEFQKCLFCNHPID